MSSIFVLVVKGWSVDVRFDNDCSKNLNMMHNEKSFFFQRKGWFVLFGVEDTLV